MLFAWLMWATLLASRLRDGRAAGGGSRPAPRSGPVVFVHPTAPLYALTAFAALALRARDARAVLREAWPGALAFARRRSCPTTRRRCTCSATATASAPARSGGRTFTGRPVWEDALPFIAPGRTTSTTSASSALVGLVALLVRGGRAVVFCAADRRRAGRVLQFVPANGRLGALLRPLHDPGRPGVPGARLAGVPRSRAGQGRRTAARVRACSSRGFWCTSCAIDLRRRSTRARPGIEAVADAASPPALRARCSSATTGSRPRLSSALQLRPPGEPPRPLPLARASRRCRSSTTTTCILVCRSSRTAAPRYGIWLFYAAAPGRAASRGDGARRQVRGVVARGRGLFFLVRPSGPAARER